MTSATTDTPTILETRDCELVPGGLSYRLGWARVTGWLTLSPDAYGWPDEPTGRRVVVLPGLPADGSTWERVPVVDGLVVNGVPIGNIAPIDTDEAASITDGGYISAWSHNVRRCNDNMTGRAPEATTRRVIALAAHAVRDFASRGDYPDRIHQVEAARAPERLQRLSADLGIARAERDAWQQHLARLTALIRSQQRILGHGPGQPDPHGVPEWPDRHADPNRRSIEVHTRTGRDSETYLRRSGRIDYTLLHAEPADS